MTTALDHDATLDCLNLHVHQFVEWLRKTKVDSFKMVQTYEQLTAYLKELLVSEKVPDQLALHNTLAHYFAVVMGYNACAFNFGQIATESTKCVMMLHYSPTSDKGARRLAMTGSMHTMDDTNSCLHTVQHLFLVLCAKAVVCSNDVDGKRLRDEDYNTIKHIAAQDQSIVAMDYSVITCRKGKEKHQLQAFCRKVEMCDVKYDNFVGLLLEVIGKVVSTKRVAQKLEPKVPAIAFGVNPHKFAEGHQKGDRRWVSFLKT